MADDLKISHPRCPQPPRPPRPPWPAPCRCPPTDRAFDPNLLDVVAVYDNPLHWVSRYANFLRFEDSMIEARVRLTTVETAYGQLPFDLPERVGVRRVRLRANSICWRKENLAQIGVAAIPDAQYLALVDGDMLFHDPLWVEQVLQALQIHRIVQISSDIIWLGPRNEFVGSGKSFIHWYLKSRRAHTQNLYWHKPSPVEMLDWGYPGGAWGYRREAFESMGGLLDVCLLGAADYHMAMGYFDLADLLLTDNDYTPQYRAALKAWKERARAAIGEDIGLVPGIVYHLWHGPLHARRYSTREQILIRNHYDPNTDIVRRRDGLIELAGNKPKLRDDILAYFTDRDEDTTAL
jgi:hypothetical protein